MATKSLEGVFPMRRLLSQICGHKANTTRRNRPTNKVRYHLAVESLEDRYVPSTLIVLNGVLTYTAGAGIANALTISAGGNNYTFTDTPEIINAPGLPGSGTHTVTVPKNFVGSMNILLGDGNDTVDVGKFVGGTLIGIDAPVSVDGGAGSDSLRVNDPASDVSGTYTVTAATVSPSDAANINYTGVERLSVTAGAFFDTFAVQSTA